MDSQVSSNDSENLLMELDTAEPSPIHWLEKTAANESLSMKFAPDENFFLDTAEKKSHQWLEKFALDEI